MHVPQTTTRTVGFGCIEDRTLALLNGETFPTDSELKQAPGADIFFTSVRDLLQDASAPGSVSHTQKDAVVSDVAKTEVYRVHNDTNNGGDFGGCGFVAHQKEIYSYLAENTESILRDHVDVLALSYTEAEVARATAGSAARLASGGYFADPGAEVIEAAVAAGAELITYADGHTASTLVIDSRNATTYDSREANNESTDSSTSFNVDTDDDMRARAREFGIDSADAVALAKVLSIATVRVLGADGAVTRR